MSKPAVCQDRACPAPVASSALACALAAAHRLRTGALHPTSPPPRRADPAKADAVMRSCATRWRRAHLKAVIVRVTVDGKEVVTQAVGDSMTGVPATTEHALPQRRGRDLLRLDTAADPRRREEGRPRRQAVEMAARRAERRPGDARAAGPDDLRLRRLRHRQHRVRTTRSTRTRSGSGQPDELLGFARRKPLLYEPGTNWNYAHTNYVLLGKALEKATGEDMPKLL